MRKEITPDMYNYNKYPGPVFISFDNQVKSDDLTFTIVEDKKSSFQVEAFTQRFSEILLKYDYIVGDWGKEQLRLKGFYRDDRRKGLYDSMSYLEDYLKEYCNFGCAYFILENAEPRDLVFEEEQEQRPKRRRRRSRPRAEQGTEGRERHQRPTDQNRPRSERTSKRSTDRRQQEKNQKPVSGGFKKTQRQQTKSAATSKETTKAGHFTIRQKG